MSARIMIDLDRVYPVFGGRWHRAGAATARATTGRADHHPCGQVDEAEYVNAAEQTLTVQTCWPCDLAYRRLEGVMVLPTHPGLRDVLPPN
jgi:hypothetical protein